MKAVLLGAVVAITSTLAHAEDMAEVISRYRHANGLSTVSAVSVLNGSPLERHPAVFFNLTKSGRPAPDHPPLMFASRIILS